MKNVFLTTLMCLFVAISSFAEEGQLTETINWELTEGVLFIAGTGEMPEYENPEDFPWHESRASIIAVLITNQVTNISGNAFSNCSSLTSIIMPNRATSIGNNAFSNCSSLHEVTITNNIVNIGSGAFSGCSSIQTITIPESVTSIGENAFLDCSLTSIIMKGEVPPTITAETFASIDRSIEVIVPDNSAKRYSEATYWNEFTSLQAGNEITASGTMGKLTWNLANGKLTISGKGEMPNYYDEYPEWYMYREYVTEFVIEEGITSIGDYALADLNHVASVELPNTLRTIGIKAFNFWTSLKEIVIPDGVTSIDGAAFGNCHNLKKITIPSSVTSIEWDIFNNCISLKTVIMDGEIPPVILDSTFGNLGNSIIIIVPEASIEQYRSAPYWGELASLQAQGTSIEEIDTLLKIYVENGCIIVEGTNEEVSVINLSGRTIAKGYLTQVEVTQAGIYLVRVGNQTTKIFVSK